MNGNENRGAEIEVKGTDGPGSVGIVIEERQATLVDLLESQLVGQTVASIKTKNELMRINVEGVKMTSLDEVKSGGKGKSEVLGMLLCQDVRRMVDFGGTELSIMIEIDFDVVAFQEDRQKKFNRHEDAKKETSELAEEVVVKPSREDMEDTIHLAVLEKRYSLKKERSEFLQNRRSTRASTTPTRSTASTCA